MSEDETPERIIDLRRTVEERRVDPFEIDVINLFDRLRPYFEETDDPRALVKDAEAVFSLSQLVESQSEWIQNRVGNWYVDPILALYSIEKKDTEELASMILESLHPIASKEQLTMPRLQEAVDYWDELVPLAERGPSLPEPQERADQAEMDLLEEAGFLSREDFRSKLEELERSLTEMSAQGEVEYQELVASETFEEAAEKAFLVSFLCSTGRATMEIDPLEEKTFVRPDGSDERPGESVAVSLRREDFEFPDDE